MLKTKINKIENDWKDVKNKCRTTINKEHTDNIPSSEFKQKILISEHSPIRLIKVNWMWKNIKSWVSVHFCRHHIGIEKWISTQRTDRTGINRDELPQGNFVTMEAEANAQALINIARVRLCYQASKETREYMEDLKLAIKQHEPELADVLVPNCIYRCGCSEFNSCGFWDKFKEKYNKDELTDIIKRYKLYNNEFYQNKGGI